MVVPTVVVLLGFATLVIAAKEAGRQRNKGASAGRTVACAAFSPTLFALALLIGNAINPGVL